MADVQHLLKEYVERQKSGGSTDPTDLLEQTEGQDRELLATLIDGYWATAPAQAWDKKAAEGSLAERVGARVAKTFAAEPESPLDAWTALRNRAKLTRNEVSKRLAAGIGVPTKQEKVHAYYHQLENGWLDTDRVSPSVFDSLGEILGASAQWLRSISTPQPPESASLMWARSDEVLARRGRPDPELAEPEAASQEKRLPAEDEWDEVDELFRGA